MMAFSLNDLVPYFYGRDVSDKGGQQDPAEFIETLLFAIDGQTYTDETRKQTANRVIFRIHLRDKALTWYQSLAAEVRGNWESLEASFLTRFALVPRKEVDQTRFLNLVVNFRQRGRNIVEYTREGDKLNAECPEKFRDVLGHQFIAGLDDKRKIVLVQVYLGANKSTFSYVDARQAVEKAYQRFGEPSPFDNLRSQPSSPPPSPVQSELVALLQSLRIPSPVPLRDNPLDQPNSDNASGRGQNSRPTFYHGIYCHNCCEEGHYSTSCSRPVVSGAQRKENRWAIDELSGGPRQYSQGPGMVPGLPPPQSALAVVASAGVGREQGSQRMNNIGMANVVILKRPTKEKAEDDYENCEYSITATNQSHELAPTKFAGPKVVQPTLQVTTPVTRTAEKPLVQQASQNLERLSEKIAWSPSLSPSPPEDDKMKGSTTIRADSHGMKGALHPGQDRQVQFEDQDDGVYNRPTPQHYQRKTSQPKIQLTQAIVSSWGFEEEKKLAGPNLIRTVALASKFWTPPAIETIALKDKEGCDQLSLDKWVYKAPDQGPRAKTIWGRSIPKILHLMNDRPVCLDGFSLVEIILGYVPEWKIVYGKAQDMMLGITHRAMQEAEQGKAKDMEKKRKGLGIEKMIDKRRRNNELLWSDQYRKICRVMKEIYRPPDRILRAKSNHLSLSIF